MSAARLRDPVRVLVVDDQQIYRDTAAFVLEMTEGFELVGTAESGEDGVRRAVELGPDLVLMDINMGGIDGLEATRRVVAADPSITVIVFSTHSATEYEPLALDAGAAAFIGKGDLSPGMLSSTWAKAV